MISNVKQLRVTISPAPSIIIAHDTPNPRTIFHDDWWLKLASKGQAQQVEVLRDGIAIGYMSYVTMRRHGMTYVQTPPYTRLLGPLLFLPPSKTSKRLRNTRSIVKELIEQLPTFDYYYNCCAADPDIALAFSLQGFDVRQTFSFAVLAKEDLASSWQNLDQKTRNLVRSAAARLTFKTSVDFEDFVGVSQREHQSTNTNDFTVMRALFTECVARQQAIILTVANEDGQSIVAAAALVWGYGTAYFWLSARDRTDATVGANALLVWQGMKFAHENGLNFDLDGYRSNGSAKFLSGFGLAPVTRLEITKTSWRYDAIAVAKAGIRRITGQMIPATI